VVAYLHLEAAQATHLGLVSAQLVL
jgi:hypothetical protein